MQLCVLIPAKWLSAKPLEGLFTFDQLLEYNAKGYNIYYPPNRPKTYLKGSILDGSMIDRFDWVFADMDLKDGTYESKDAFLETLAGFSLPPTKVVDSGNGIHVYWRVSDLDAMSYLRLQRRVAKALKTDPAVCQIMQLMRVPETMNVKMQDAFVPCQTLFSDESLVYTCEEMNAALPPISVEDEKKCQEHYNKTHKIDQGLDKISEALPQKFSELLATSHEVKDIWSGNVDDRSKGDYRLANIMLAHGFTKDEGASVLYNSAKALERAPSHRYSYAKNIVDKIWTAPDAPKDELSMSISELLSRPDITSGTPFRCDKRIDNTQHGFRLGQVIGLVAGSGVGKTTFALNMFRWFTQKNPDYHHFFVPLEQPGKEIADRWNTLCGSDTSQHNQVHIISNYDEAGNFRHLSLEEIKNYIKSWKERTGNKVGCVVIDHIGALKKKGAKDENQDLMSICHSMKAFAVQLDCMLVMQSQTNREKAGIGDLELNKDAAYGTLFFESYCDYLITLWQPLKRCHTEHNCPTVTAYKFCKIRHKNAKRDVIKEDKAYYFYFDADLELLRDLTHDEKTAFNFYLPKATNMRKQDRKTEIVEYTSVLTTGGDNGAATSVAGQTKH